MADRSITGAPPWQGRYVTLDGMRGVAALAVALFHYNISQAPHGYLAVDFFFALSGFVLCRTYLPRWQAGLGTWTFMKQRVIRLYPLFFVGIVVTTLSSISNHWTGKGDIIAPAKMAAALPFNLLMLPSPVTRTLFPMNVPAWSLFFELVANLALVLVLFRLPRIGLLVVALAGAWWLVPAVIAHTDGNLGAVWDQVGVCLARTAMSFSIGVFLGRLPQPEVRPSSWIGLLLLFAIGAMLMAPSFGNFDAWYDIACGLFVAPLLVWIGTRFEPPRAIQPIAWFLGEISYALYAVHWALMEPLRYFKDDLGWNEVLMGGVYLSACVALAWCAVRYVDVPARRWLSARRRASRSSASLRPSPLPN
ncbi:acetyltransferase [Novosphingobium sp. Rr 2-17]|uniref:acyltransferase family protein n=1 Tax=Novosphingobium sp. Rr 2-17 TaxID=555793 RepID=UPI0002698E93|nr:acyltransferase [Novosphingobium sp. Rr 2-17]EIZ80615.1 acetyltransferase [Novosphingobium sp. Rr 2-17]